MSKPAKLACCLGDLKKESFVVFTGTETHGRSHHVSCRHFSQDFDSNYTVSVLNEYLIKTRTDPLGLTKSCL